MAVCHYRYQNQRYQVIVNARTAEVQGERPYSVWKITAAVVSGVVVAGVMYLLFTDDWEIYPCSRSLSTATPTNFPTCTEPKITASSYSLYRACTPEHKITASACSLLTLVILDAAVTGGGGGIVLGVVVAIDVSKINSIII